MFYKQSAPAYDHADTMAEAVVAYKRCRKPRTFILTDDSPYRERYACVVCGALLSEPGTHGTIESAYVDYNPRTKRAHPKHYYCAWSSLLGAVCTSYDLSEAATKYAAAEGKGVTVK